MGAGSKGSLPMDEASRMARAREMGFDTDTTYYHATNADFDQFRPSEKGLMGPGVYVSDDPKQVMKYVDNDGARIMPVHIRGNINKPRTEADPYVRINDPQGFDGQQVMDQVVVFDPKNIRSKYATFDPAQSDSPVLTAGIGGRTRKDVMKDVMPKSQGARVPGTSKPLPMKGKDAPAAPAYRDDLTTAAVVGLPIGVSAGMYAYSMYKAEMYKRGQKDIPSFQEFMKMIEQEQRSRMGVPPRPGLKPQDLPQRV